MPFRRRANVMGWLLLFAGTAILLGEVLLGGRVLADRDLLTYFFPLRSVLQRLFRHGQSLLWNPYLGEGQPLAANPAHEIFYPLTWLFFLLPVRPAIAISLATHLGIGFWGTLRFLRKLRNSESAALLAATVWSFGGVFVSMMHLLPCLYGWAWIPWLAACGVEEKISPRTVAAGAVFAALILATGEPGTAMTAGAVFLGSFLSRKLSRTRFAGAVATFALALGLAAAAVVPGAALARKGIRGEGIPAERAAAKSFPPARLAELLLPRSTGNVASHRDRFYFGWRLYPERSWPFYPGLYAGALLLPLAILGFVRGGRALWSLGSVGLVGFGLSLGPPGNLWNAARALVPPFRAIRFPEKFVALAVFILVLGMSSGLDAVRRSRRCRVRVSAGMIAFGVLLAGAAVLPRLWLPALRAHPELWRGFELSAARLAVQRTLLRQAAPNIAAGALLLLIGRGPRPRRSAAALLGLLAVGGADVVASSRDFVRPRPAAWLEAKPPVIRRIELVSPLPRLVDFLPLDPPVSLPGADELGGPWDRNRVLYTQPLQWGIPLALDTDFDLTYIASTDRARALFQRLAGADLRRFARMLAGRGIGALLVWNAPVTLRDPVTVVAVPGRRPVVDAVTAIVPFHGDDGFLAAVRGYPGDLTRAAFLETPTEGPPRPLAAPSLEVVKSSNTDIRFASAGSAPGLVRVAWTNDGNWEADLDGKRWPVQTVDLSLIGIEIPPGRHAVRLLYRDSWLTLGEILSAISLLLLTALFAFFRKRRAPVP